MSNHRIFNEKKISKSEKPKLLPAFQCFRNNNFHVVFSRHVARAVMAKPAIPKRPSAEDHFSSDCSDKTMILRENHLAMEAINLEVQNRTLKNIDAIIIERTAISSKTIDEINHLVKRLSLSFSAKKAECSFYIEEGIFKNTRFDLYCFEKDLDVVLSHAEDDAIALISQHQEYLATKLAAKEINLRGIRFK